MMILVSYDISTMDSKGRRRLRQVAKTCQDWGQRVQNSLFECDLDPAQFANLKNMLLQLIDPSLDSLRFYFLGNKWRRRVEHFGTKPISDLRHDPLII